MNIPEGFKLVPVEPTEEMQESVRDAWESEGAISAKQMYKAMIAAAPASLQAAQTVTMANVMRAYEYACEHPHKYLRGTSNWCAAVAWKLNQLESSAPTPPQPIYDEPKERELFEEFSRRIVAHDAANFPIRWCDCVTDEEIEGHLNTWLACAQSRAKSVEVGDE